MKHKLWSILSAAAITAASLPVSLLTATASDFSEKFKTADGKLDATIWYQNTAGDFSYEEQKNGDFTCEWKDIPEFWVLLALTLKSKHTYKEYSAFDWEYAMDLEPTKGDGYYGLNGWLENCTGDYKTAEFYIIDGWWGEPPVADAETAEPVGTIEIDGVKYDVSKEICVEQPSIHGHDTFVRYWSVRSSNLGNESGASSVSNHISASAHFDEWQTLGLDFSGKLYDIGFCVAGYDTDGTLNLTDCDCLDGKLQKTDTPVETTTTEVTTSETTAEETTTEITAAETTTEETTTEITTAFESTTVETTTVVTTNTGKKAYGMKDAFADSFECGQQISDAKDADLTNYNRVVCNGVLYPDMLLDQEACKDGGSNTEVAVSLNAAAPLLKFCEENEIPVTGGAFISFYNTPIWFFRENFDESGKTVSQEVMNQRMESLIKNTFAAISKQFPKLKLDSYIVCSGVFDFHASDITDWEKIYQDETVMITNAFTFARKYAPKGCKLYLEDSDIMDIFDMQTALIETSKTLKTQNLIDGIAVEAYYHENILSHLNAFEETLAPILRTGLDIQITHLYIQSSSETASSVDKSMKQMLALFQKYSDSISCVTVGNEIFQDNKWHSAAASKSGDINEDGKLTVSDAILLARVTANDTTVPVSQKGMDQCDMDGDGKLSASDITLMLRRIAHIDT